MRETSSGTTFRDGQERLHIDENVERKSVLKLDIHIAPIVMVLYLIPFFDMY